MWVGGKCEFTPGYITHLSRLATLGNIGCDPGRLGKRRPLGDNLPYFPQPRTSLLNRQMFHPINGCGVRLRDEGAVMLGRKVFNCSGEIVVEFFEFEPDCEAFEFPLEGAP